MKIMHIKSAGWFIVLFGILAPVVFAQDIPIPEERFSDPPRPTAAAQAKEERLKLAVATNPESAEAWTNFGWRLYKNGRYNESEWVMSEARKRSPNDPYILWLSGLASYAMGNYPDAKKYLWQMWTDNKTWPDTVDMAATYDILGRIAFQQSDLFQAAYFLGKSSDEDPKNWQVHFLLGVAEWYRRRYGEALDAFGKARSLKSNDPVLLRCYAAARVAVDERHCYYTKEAAQQDLYPEAKKDALQADEDFKSDIKVIEAAIKADPEDSNNFELLGRFYQALGQTQEAVAALRKAVALNEKDASSKYVLAKVLLSTGTKEATSEAKQLLLQSIALSPGYWEGAADAPHVGLLINILIEEGNFTQAQALADWLSKQDMEN